MADPTRLEAGDKAPAITLLDQNGEKVKLSDFKGRPVLVYFYPKADTPGCTTQSCGLRDVAGDIGDAVILGISPDLPAKLAKFDEKYGLGFTLLSDPEHAVAEAYGVWGEKKNYGRTYMGIIRSAFLIDETGKIAGGLVQDQPEGHARRSSWPRWLVSPPLWSPGDPLPRPEAILPHRPPFLLVDEITEIVPDERATGFWRLDRRRGLLRRALPRLPRRARRPDGRGHRPARGLRRLAGERDAGNIPLFGGIDKARFRRQVARATRSTSRSSSPSGPSGPGKGQGRATVDGELACETGLFFLAVRRSELPEG